MMRISHFLRFCSFHYSYPIFKPNHYVVQKHFSVAQMSDTVMESYSPRSRGDCGNVGKLEGGNELENGVLKTRWCGVNELGYLERSGKGGR
jgi:hypothetical protein